jgi:hypothetical protein
VPHKGPDITGGIRYMGQQQLLTLLLGLVLVVVAVLLGIEAFTENAKKSNVDALLNDAMDIALSAQSWMLTPRMLGGGGATCAERCDWGPVSFDALGLKSGSGGSYENMHGIYFLDGLSRSSNLYVIGMNREYGNRVVLTVRGVGPGKITSQIHDMSVQPR